MRKVRVASLTLSAVGLLTAAVTLFACEGMREGVRLQNGLASEFGSLGVKTNLTNERFLSITFHNSPLGALQGPQRAAACRRVAEYVRDHYANYSQLDSVSVDFSSGVSTSVASVTRTEPGCSFTAGELVQTRASH